MTTAAPAVLGYVSGTSWLHRASPGPKLAWLTTALVVVLPTYEPIVLVAVLGIGLLLCLSAGVGATFVRTLVALAPIGASMLVLQALAPVGCHAGCTPVAALGPLTLYVEGMSHALALVARLVAIEAVAVALLSTMHPSDLFATLRGLRLPYEVALMAMLSLQLIPQFRAELDQVLRAQRARGLRRTGIAALGPTLVPLVAGAFDRLTVLVLGLEARGLGAGPRTSYRQVRLSSAGLVSIAAASVAGVIGLSQALTRWGASQATVIVLPGPVAVGIVLAAAIVFAVVMTAGLRSLVRT